MANVLIFGASRGIGLATAKQALEHGHRVRAVARSAGSIGMDHNGLQQEGLETRNADALNRDDVASALNGMDVVVQSLGMSLGPDMFLGPVMLFSDATRILVEAMKASGVKRLICVTGYGAGDSRDSVGLLQMIPFRLALGRVYDDKDLQERIVKRSGLDWTLVRPVFLTDGPRTGRYQVLAEPKSWRNGFISRADVADFIVKQIGETQYVGQAPVLAY